MVLITAQLLRSMGATRANADKFAKALQEAANEFGITDKLDIAHWLAQIFQESGALQYVREIWDGKGAQARYDTRVDLGNTPKVDGDGKHNRGIGLIQTTGEYNIERVLKALGYPPNSNENLATVVGATRSAGFFWKDKKLSEVASTSGLNVTRCTRCVNGGLTHLVNRQAYFNKAWLALNQ